ncbi:MAG: ferrous iron transport protein A [Leptothrix sp. (in: Bacteria)]|nr:ferrous iron transport protein A [Leptothrix sp. (in: b-proteobacteria)]
MTTTSDPADPARSEPAPHCLLHDLPLRESAAVVEVTAPSQAPEWSGWLAEIGFLPGERVQLLGRAVPGGDPLVVRVGDSTFALRVAEAACVQVQPLAGGER